MNQTIGLSLFALGLVLIWAGFTIKQGQSLPKEVANVLQGKPATDPKPPDPKPAPAPAK